MTSTSGKKKRLYRLMKKKKKHHPSSQQQSILFPDLCLRVRGKDQDWYHYPFVVQNLVYLFACIYVVKVNLGHPYDDREPSMVLLLRMFRSTLKVLSFFMLSSTFPLRGLPSLTQVRPSLTNLL